MRALLLLGALALSSTAFAGTWQQDHAADYQSLSKSNPELATYVREMQPTPARNGSMMFRQPRLASPDAAPAILHRLMSGQDSEQVQGALTTAWLASTDDARGAAWLVSADRPLPVRAAAALHARFLDADIATVVLDATLADTSPMVRLAAVNAVGRRADGAAWSTHTMRLLSDSDVQVRATSARTLGYLGVRATDELVPLLHDNHADVRIEALHALNRTDAVSAQAHMQTMVQDQDARVRHAAQNLVKQR